MKQLEYLYFNIYNHYSRRSYFPSELFMRLQVMYLICLATGGWILLLQSCYLRFIRQSWFTAQSGAMTFALMVYLILGLIFHKIFIVDEHDQKILEKYSNAWGNNPNKKRDLMLSIFVAVVPYVLLVSLKMVFPRD